jgi:AraC-like DNA-binding protein
MEPRVRLREFAEASDGHLDLEIAQAGLLVVIAIGESYQVGVGTGPLTAGHGGFVIGAQSRYGRSRLLGCAEGVQVELPWCTAARVFGPAVASLADQALPLADPGIGLPSAAILAERLGVTSPGERAAVVAGWLRSAASRQPAPNPTVLRALQLIDAGASSVSALARDLGCSRGYLHRAVRAAIGQPPSVLLRVARLHRVLGAEDAAHSWAQRADQAGYVDHAHLCHETRALAGRTPRELLGGRW